jgi:hypothetical protein
MLDRRSGLAAFPFPNESQHIGGGHTRCSLTVLYLLSGCPVPRYFAAEASGGVVPGGLGVGPFPAPARGVPGKYGFVVCGIQLKVANISQTSLVSGT